MIVVTGALGFIGSNLVHDLNLLGHQDLLLIDHFRSGEKWINLHGLHYQDVVTPDHFLKELQGHHYNNITKVYHMGACSSTTEQDMDFLWQNNTLYTKALWNYCSENSIPFVYASSAATYGSGSLGFSDSQELTPKLKPLNKYGFSKHAFDLWALKQKLAPPFWLGLKFFNVYGPGEKHKGAMRSMAIQAFEQITRHQKVKLFKSHRNDFSDGEQQRDFIYIKDAIKMIHLLEQRQQSGISNIGTGKAHSFKQLVQASFKAMQLPEKIEYIDMPHEIRDQYQYYTQAEHFFNKELPTLSKPLEENIAEYINHYLLPDRGVGDGHE
jgi:ADP-L-glycero-D-manno-heptose 6-epimerase